MSDRTDIAPAEEPGRALALVSSGNVIQSILAAAKDPDVDADKVKTLHDLAVGMLDRERAAQFNAAKIAAIREMPAIYKRGKSDKHRYAKFEDLHRAAMPVLARYGLTIDFKVGSNGNAITVQPVLRHENGWVEEGGVMSAPPDQGPGRTPVQAIGSTTSYLKRHSFKAIMNIIEDGEDDDGVGFRETDQKNDRQERLILDAEAQALEGAENYSRWYGSLNAKDKLFLVRTGTHARCGGGTALPPPAGSSPIGRQEERQAEPEPEVEDAVVEEVDDPGPPPPLDPPAADEPEPDPKTAEGWTTIFERNCAAATTIDRVDELKTVGAGAIRKLSAEHPKLWERIDRAEMEARERIKAAPASDDDLFPGDR